MKTAMTSLKRSLTISTLALALIAGGCAGSASNSTSVDPPASGFRQASLKSTDSATRVAVAKPQAPAPRVQDCGLVAISSPPKYVCNGKVYTSTELAKIRNDEARKYQSGQ